MAVIVVAACAAGASATVLLTSGNSTSATTSETETQDLRTQRSTGDICHELLQTRPQAWAPVSERLASNEELVYKTVLDADSVLPQSEIVDPTDISKATVSRTLDSLETRDLIERKRRGMGNVVRLT
ncbi:helix-turn-helix transcriptional regulator [Haloarcula rubripromontorii]|uniref:helix-turn-helix transcriptional regulator n=1 Tax=Haloarcula rubripromontorii TaxID=1705562 RepID=UPI0030B84831